MIVQASYAALWFAAALTLLLVIVTVRSFVRPIDGSSSLRAVAAAQIAMSVFALSLRLAEADRVDVRLAGLVAAVLVGLAVFGWASSAAQAADAVRRVASVLVIAGGVIAVGGALLTVAFTETRDVRAETGQQLRLGPWYIEFAAVSPVAGPGWTAIEGELRASRGSGVEQLQPQLRTEFGSPVQTSRAAVAMTWRGRLSAELGSAVGDGLWSMRLSWRPFLTLVWGGGLLIALACVASFLAGAWRWRQQRSAREDPTE